MIKAVDHITINVNDLHATKKFYEEILELSPLPTKDFGDHRYYFYQLPGGMKLEIGEYDFDESISHDLSTTRGKIRHIAFEVTNIESLVKRFHNFGYDFITPVEYRETLGFSSGIILDPNGIELEFLQYQ